jgi:hypothetical protein
MKRLSTLLLAFMAAGTILAQNIVIREPAGAIVNGTTITVNSTSGVVEALHELWVINNSTGQMKINCKRYEVSVTPYTKNYFCWYLCLNEVSAGAAPLLTHPSSTAQCPYMAPGDTLPSFSAHHKPQSNSGVSTYRYVFYDVDNTNDSSYVDIVFDIALGVNNITPAAELKMYPNPASESTTLSYSLPAGQNHSVIIYDALGQKVAEYKISTIAGTIQLDLSEIREGIYFVALLENGKAVQTRRLLINR